MLDRVRETIARRNLLSPGEKLLLAISGGLDSMALWECLRLLEGDERPMVVAHFNHRLRGAESDQDEALVRAEAERRNVPFVRGEAEVARHAVENGVSIEMAARRLRHEFLAKAARETGALKIALGHHADDQVETFWLRLLRGVAGEGLAGMRWIGPSPADPGVRLIRPLLATAKSELRQFAAARGVKFREDSSNAERHFQRNRIRNEVLPVLESYQPQLREITLRAAEVLGEEKAFLQETAGKSRYEEAHPAVQRELLRQRLLELDLHPSFLLIEALRGSPEPVSAAAGLWLRRGAGGRIVAERAAPEKTPPEELSIDLSQPGRVEYGGREIAWETVERRGPGAPGTEYFDADALGRRAILRSWRAGDRFQPIGMGGAVKGKDLFVNLKVRARARHERILATRANGEIFWIEGLRIGEAAKVRPETKRVLAWRWTVCSEGGAADSG